VRATLVLGVAASVVANILHALDNPISQAIAAWPPLALLLTVELISRVPVHRRSLAFARLIATATIAGIAAWVSYWHMVGVAARYGESGASPYLLPLSVDGLIVVASICLVELGGRITSLEAEERGAGVVAASGAGQVGAGHARVGSAGSGSAGAESSEVAAAGTARADGHVAAAGKVAVAEKVATAGKMAATGDAAAAGKVAARAGAKRSTASVPSSRAAGPSPRRETAAAKVRRSPAETVALAARIKAERPTLTDAELAAELGISTARWRTIRRESSQSRDLRLAA
jgi:hypothetical protein